MHGSSKNYTYSWFIEFIPADLDMLVAPPYWFQAFHSVRIKLEIYDIDEKVFTC